MRSPTPSAGYPAVRPFAPYDAVRETGLDDAARADDDGMRGREEEAAATAADVTAIALAAARDSETFAEARERAMSRGRKTRQHGRRVGIDTILSGDAANDRRLGELAFSELAFSALADSVRDYAIFLIDPTGVINYWGEGARLMSWWTKSQAEGAHLRLLYPNGGAEDGTAEEHLRIAVATGEYAGEGQRVRSDGSAFWAASTLTALRDERGVLLGFTKVTRDLTARRAVESSRVATMAAEQARIAADATVAAKSRFLATMSHEIRTPINAVLGYVTLLEQGAAGAALSVEQHRWLDRMRICGEHLAKLVTEVIDLSRLDAGGVRVLKGPVRLGDAITGALALVEPQAAASGIVLADETSASSVVQACCGDEHRIRQILVNVLANAIKFTSARDGAPGRVSVSAGAASQPPPDSVLEGAGPWVYVRVEDNGRGIAAGQLASVFDPFVQVDVARAPETVGAGLGLAISRRLARLMGGDLTARSTPEVGSTFVLWLEAAH